MAEINSPFVMVLADEDQEKGNNDLKDGFVDYLTKGVASAAGSSTVGLLNTFNALGSSIGMDTEMLDEQEAIGSFFGKETANFYERHKVGADAAGLLISGLGMGGLALKATKLAANAGFLGQGLKAATGMENAGVVLGSQAVAKARSGILATGTYTWNNPVTLQALGAGAKVAAVETVMFTAFNSTFNNQNAALNPDRLSYWDSFAQTVKDDLTSPLNLGLGVAGGAFSVFRTRGFLREELRQADMQVNSLFVSKANALGNVPTGSAAFLVRKELKSLQNDAAYQFDELGVFNPELAPMAKARKTKLEQQLTREYEGFVAKMVDGQDEVASKEISGFLLNLDIPDDKLADIVANAQKIGRITTKQSEKLDSFFKLTKNPSALLENVTDLYDAVSKVNDITARILTSSGRQLEAVKLDKNQTYWRLANPKIGGLNANGMASPNPTTDIVAVIDGQVTPIGWAWQKEISQDQVDNYNAVRKHYGLSEMTADERRMLTVLHELGHLKNNGLEAVTKIKESIGKGDTLAEEILKVSFRRRPDYWLGADFAEYGVNDIDSYIAKLRKGEVPTQVSNGSGTYLNNSRELLADAAALLLHPDIKVSQEYAKLAPTLATFLQKHGGVGQPWKQREAFLNLKTGEVNTGILPAAGDVMPLQVVDNKLVNSSTKAVVTAYDTKMFDFAEKFTANDSSGVRMETAGFSEQWTLASQMNLPYDDANKLWEVPSLQDLPLVERAIALASKEGSDALGISLGGKVMSVDQAKAFLKEEKLRLLDEFTGRQQYNEQHIAQILNIPVEVALGHRKTGDELLPFLEGRDYTKPLHVRVAYDKVDIAKADADSRTESAIQMRLAAESTYKMQASEVALKGQTADMIAPEIVDRAVDKLSGMDGRQGNLFSQRPEFGTLRDYVAQIGRQAQELMTEATQRVEKTFEGFAKTINHANSYTLRAEIVGIDNLIRRDWYTMRTIKSVDESGDVSFTEVFIKKSLWDDKEQAELLDGLIEAGDVDELISTFGKSETFAASKDAGEFFRMHKDTNQARLSTLRMIKDAQGRGASYQDDVIYPPPRDLKVTPHHMFVVPNDLHATNNNSKFMITAASEADLNAKVNAITAKYGKQYRIITKQDAKNYAIMQGEYAQGKAFDELEFDSSLRREFKDSELAPNMDVYQSSTMERYRAYHARQEEGVIRRGIELRYNKMFAELDRLDNAYGATRKESVFKKGITEEDNIWADTKRTALALKGKTSEFIENYDQVSGWINRKGSALIDGTMSLFTKQKEELSIEQMMQINKALDDIGFTNPYENFHQMLAASPETIKSRSLPTLTRTLNVLASTTMLTADVLAAVTNAISSPIMSLPVIREALKELKGTEKGVGLARMLTATNPISGAVEPSAQRLMMDATQKFWTKEGKDFIEEMRKRKILRDDFVEYRESQDMSDFNGVHGLGAITNKIEQLRKTVGKYTQYQKADDFSKFMTAWAVKQICEVRGITGNEMYSVISSSVDKTSGIFRAAQRGQLFNGVIGQAVGLFQSYTFNWLQNSARNAGLGEKGNLAIMAAAQASIFGVRSMPGFELVNEAIGNRNRGNQDLYSYTNATEYDENGQPVNPWMQYVMYGLGSHALGIPVDLFNRGNMNPRQGQPLYVPNPTDISQYPAFNIVANGIATLQNTAEQMSKDVPAVQAIIHGLAHNGMNRPLQGLFTIAQGQVTSRDGTVQFDNSNYINAEMALGYDTAAMTARALGGKPLREAILVDEQYRQKAYQVENKARVAEIGAILRLKLQAGEEIMGEEYDEFARKYEAAGGRPQGFNAYMTQILKGQNQGAVQKFKDKLQADGEMRRSYQRMLEDQDSTPVYDLYPQAMPMRQEEPVSGQQQ